MRRTALAALCLAAVATAGLTGCTGEDKTDTSTSSSKPKEEPFAGLTGGEIVERALKATAGASSLRMKGDVPDEDSGGTLRFDLALNKQGECAGTLAVGGEGEAELILTGDALYAKYDEDFLRAQSEGDPKAEVDATVALLADKWTKMSARSEDAEGLVSLCDLDLVLGDLKDGRSEATRGKTTTLDGTPAITLEEREGKDRFTLYVATKGEPYLLRIDSTSAEDTGSFSLTDYGKPVQVQEPDGHVLDLDSLG